MKKAILVLGVILVLLTGIGCERGEEVTFPDPSLEAAIREAINKPKGPIYTGQLEELIYLDASQKDITDLAGLEHCTNLTMLYLDHNHITDISPLSGLTNLTGLSLNNNQITDISPLSSLTNLTELYLGFNQIADISPLISLPILLEVNLKYNPLSADSVFTYIPQLKASGVSVS